MLRRALITLVLVTVLVAACGEAASTPGTTSEPAPTAPTTTIAPDPYGLDDLALAYTVPAAMEPRIFSGENPGYSGDVHQNAGNLVLGDGSVQQVTSGRAREQLRDAGVATDSTQEFIFPWDADSTK